MATSSTPVHPEYAKALKDIAAAKPVINFLTILAGDHSGSAASIAETIVQYAEKSPKDGLALLYLSDSIIKNVGGEYRQAFSQRILPFFVGLYGKGDQRVRKSVRHTRNTWNDIFARDTLVKLDEFMMRADGVGPSKSMRRGAPGPAHAAPQPLPSRQQHDPRRAPALYPPAQEPAPFAHPQQGWGQGGARPGEWREPPHAGGWSAPPHGGSGAPPGGDYYQAVDALQRAEAELRSGRLPPHRHQQLVVVAEQLRREVDEWHRRGPPPARGAPPPVLGGADPRGYFGPGPAASMMPPPRAPGPDPRLASQAPPPGKDGRRLSANSIFQKLLNSGLIDTGAPAGGAGAAAPTHSAPGDSSALPSISLTEQELKRVVPQFITMLYEDQPLQCRNCGRRFPASQQAQLDDHYDWHFRMNREAKTKTKIRGWFLKRDDWINHTGKDTLQDRTKSAVFEGPSATSDGKDDAPAPEDASVVVDGTDNCGVCGEKFETVYKDEEEEWHYQSALRTDKGTFHVSCFADAAHSGSLESPSAKVPPVRVTDADAGEGSTVVEPPSALPDDIGGAAAPSPKKMKI